MLKTEEDFALWIEQMDDAMDDFLAKLPPDVRGKLDSSPDSLGALEAWLLSRYATSEELLDPSQDPIYGGAARYLGETIRENLGGGWAIDLETPDNVYYRIPAIEIEGKPTPLVPHLLISASLNRRTGVFLRTIFENARKQLAQRK